MREIPKGSEVYINGKKVAVSLKRLVSGDMAESKDFKPPIAEGICIADLEFRFEGKIIYNKGCFVNSN